MGVKESARRISPGQRDDELLRLQHELDELLSRVAPLQQERQRIDDRLTPLLKQTDAIERRMRQLRELVVGTPPDPHLRSVTAEGTPAIPEDRALDSGN